jgi:hypothetical protein
MFRYDGVRIDLLVNNRGADLDRSKCRPFFAVVTTYIASVVNTKRVAGNS